VQSCGLLEHFTDLIIATRRQIMKTSSLTLIVPSSITTLSPGSSTALLLEAARHTHQILRLLPQVNREASRAIAAPRSATRAAGGDRVQKMVLGALGEFLYNIVRFSLFFLVMGFADKSASPASEGFTCRLPATLTSRTLSLFQRATRDLVVFFWKVLRSDG
jgi:hypothetical protein